MVRVVVWVAVRIAWSGSWSGSGAQGRGHDLRSALELNGVQGGQINGSVLLTLERNVCVQENGLLGDGLGVAWGLGRGGGGGQTMDRVVLVAMLVGGARVGGVGRWRGLGDVRGWVLCGRVLDPPSLVLDPPCPRSQ